MIPAEARNISAEAVDLPGLWRQLEDFRVECAKEPIETGADQLVEANDEAGLEEIE